MAKTSTPTKTSSPTSLDRIGVGIDTARYGHRVCFLRPDREPAAIVTSSADADNAVISSAISAHVDSVVNDARRNVGKYR